jgi:hypothetical protein
MESVTIKSNSICDKTILFSLLYWFIILIVIILLANYFKLNDDQLGQIMPYILIFLIAGTVLIFFRFRKPVLIIEKTGDNLILKNKKNQQIIDRCNVKNVNIEYGYYNYRYRSIINTYKPVISFKFSNYNIVRCGFTLNKLVESFWEEDDPRNDKYNMPINLTKPDYIIKVKTFDCLAKILIPNHKLILNEL